MYLLKKGNFEFNEILANGYSIDEQQAVTTIKQLANGKRKKIMAGYNDCIITLTIGGLDENTTKQYISNLTDGLYTYWSINEGEHKQANFIVTMPTQVMESSIGSKSFGDFQVILQKSSEVM